MKNKMITIEVDKMSTFKPEESYILSSHAKLGLHKLGKNTFYNIVTDFGEVLLKEKTAKKLLSVLKKVLK